MRESDDTHSTTIGYLLWIFGFTGSHRFYFGRPISGTIWFFTLGLFLIGWIIDLFLIPSMDREADLRFRAGPVDYSVAWILLTFLGLLGIHRFYMGKVVTGKILYVESDRELTIKLDGEATGHKIGAPTSGSKAKYFNRGDFTVAPSLTNNDGTNVANVSYVIVGAK